MKPNQLTLEDYMLMVAKDHADVMQHVRQTWLDNNTDPAIAAYTALEALQRKHETIAASVMEVAS